MEDKGSRVGKTNVYSKMQGTSCSRKWHNVLITNAHAKFVWLAAKLWRGKASSCEITIFEGIGKRINELFMMRDQTEKP